MSAGKPFTLSLSKGDSEDTFWTMDSQRIDG
jgi:hypothetical protein